MGLGGRTINRAPEGPSGPGRFGSIDALRFSQRNSNWRQSVLCLLFCTAIIVPAVPALAQERARVFLDCGACDFNYLRQEIQFVDYVRDRTDADVHVLATTQRTGGRGRGGL